MKLTRELARRFEDHLADNLEALMRSSIDGDWNPEGYAFYRDGGIRASCSSNPTARWATSAYHLNQRPAESVRNVVTFFHQHGAAAKVRIIPDGFSPEQADVLTAMGLRHIGFHAMLWMPLTDRYVANVVGDIREAVSPEEIDAHIDIQLGVYQVREEEMERLRPLRRRWWSIPELKFYLAYVDGVPAAQAILDCRGNIGYLAAAGTLPNYRNRGLHLDLIRRRIADAQKHGCEIILGAADFENNSRTNQMACGLHVAYTAAWWLEPAATLS